MLALRFVAFALVLGIFSSAASACEVGDVNRDGQIDFLDISSFIQVLSSGVGQCEADIDRNGIVNFLDIPFFIAMLTSTNPTPVEDELHQLVRVNANMLVEDPQYVLDIAQRVKDSGGTGIVLSDSKLTNYWSILTQTNYVQRVNTIIDGIRNMGLEVHLTVRGLGYSSSYLAIKPNLAAGYPVEATPLMVQGDKLVPVETATVIDGGFEQTSDSNRPLNSRFQDAPGVRTFVDTNVSYSGNSSLRTDATGGENSRLFTTVDVLPWQQYTLKVWVKTDSLSAANWLILVRDMETKAHRTQQRLSEPRDGGGRTYFNSVSDYTTDWTQMALSFNSADSTQLDVTLAVFGGTSGSAWWDDLAVEATPTMNWLQRDSLPVSLIDDNGAVLTEGVDIETIRDTQLGQSRHGGSYDTYHSPPDITLTAAGLARLNQGDTVELNGYHALITHNGQTGMSWNDPEVFQLRSRAVSEIWNTFAPDGIHIGDNEIRTGGAEPLDRAFGSTGQALAAHFDRLIDDVNQITNCEAELFMWSDMFDPDHNATAGFYQVEGNISGSWNGLDPDSITMMPWRGVGSDQAAYDATLQHFSDLGFEIVIGGFYDQDVAVDELLWRNASQGIDSVVGSMYTTWTKDFTNIEAFASQWGW